MNFYCITCKRRTDTVGEHNRKTKNGRNMVCGKCTTCGNKKCTFVAGSSPRSSPRRSHRKSKSPTKSCRSTKKCVSRSRKSPYKASYGKSNSSRNKGSCKSTVNCVRRYRK